MDKVLPTLTIIVGGLGAIYGLLAAFGVELSAAQIAALNGVAGLVLAIAGVWFHPDIPVGVKK